MRNCLNLTAACLSLLLAACAGTPPLPEIPEEPAAGANRSAVLYERWAGYVAWATRYELQPDCKPRLIEPADDVVYRGTVVLLHGFTACTQQYGELAQLLAERGYRTLLPVLPGHGRPYPSVEKNDSSTLPNARNWRQVYFAFADQINGIMAFADGDRVVGGLSGGASVALGIGFLARGQYDRILVMAPFLAISGGRFVNGTIQVLGSIPLIDLLPVAPFGLDGPCIDKRKQGRAGYCNYQLRHVVGMRGLGAAVDKALYKDDLDLRAQVIGVENDPVVANYRVRRLLGLQEEAVNTTACFLPAGIPHSMFSRADNPGVDMFWLEAFHNGVVDFIVNGAAFPTNGEVSEAEAPWELCRVD